MARRIDLDQIGDYFEDQLNALMVAAVLEADRRLKLASPVDTGRFRASWAIGENTTGDYDAGNQGESTGRNKENSSPPNSPPPGPPIGINYRPGSEKIGNKYIIHNNLPYAESLADGSSKQAKAGWVDLIGKDMQTYIKKVSGQILRSS